jgi:hypothetical protein
MIRASEMAPGFRARCVANRHGLFLPRNWHPSQGIALLALSGRCRYQTRNSAGKGGECPKISLVFVTEGKHGFAARQTCWKRQKQKPGKTHQAFIFFHIKLNTDN